MVATMTREERLALVKTLPIRRGSHDAPPPDAPPPGGCIEELISFVTGVSWTDAPPCVSPAIAAFMRAWNDNLPDDAARDRWLRDLIEPQIGTAASDAVERRRAFRLADWAVREVAPLALDGVKGLEKHEAALRALTPVADKESADAAAYAAYAADAAAYAARAAYAAAYPKQEALYASAHALVLELCAMGDLAAESAP